MKIKCPVCKAVMVSHHKNNTYTCVLKDEYIPELKANMEYSHAVVHIDDDGNQVIKRIDVPPYCFQIIDQGDIRQTRIMKLSNPAFKKRNAEGFYDKKPGIRYSDLYLEQETLIVVPNAISVDWKDKKQVEERVKMYMLFS